MNTVKAYLCGSVMCVAALLPPIQADLTAPSAWWPWMVLCSGFAGTFLLFLPASPFIKVFVVWSWVTCFFSAAPFISFTAHICLVAAGYFHTVCLSVKDFRPVFRMLKCLLIFYGFMLAMQGTRQDSLLNFGGVMQCYGTVGQHMQAASFAAILSAALMPANANFVFFSVPVSLICNSAGGFLTAAVGFTGYFYMTWHRRFALGLTSVMLAVFLTWMIGSGKLHENIRTDISRLKVWHQTTVLAIQRPITGWGVGTYRYLFPALGMIGQPGERGERAAFPSIPWKTAHNCWLQFFFEVGGVGLFMVVAYAATLAVRLRRLLRRSENKEKAATALSGLAMIGTNMMIHFPTRQISTLLLILFFTAYCENLIKGAHHGRE